MVSLKKISTYKSTYEQKDHPNPYTTKMSMMKPLTSKLFHILKASTTKVQINKKLPLLVVNSKLILADYYSGE